MKRRQDGVEGVEERTWKGGARKKTVRKERGKEGSRKDADRVAG